MMRATKCIYCLLDFGQITKDHIFPKSWYPENTSQELARWTVPACVGCNGKLGKVEEELFLRLGMCVDPRKVEASGIPGKVLRTLGIGVNLHSKEAAHRAKKLNRMQGEMKPYSGNKENVLPGFGAAKGHDPSKLKQILIPASSLLIFQEKVIRGLEYKFCKRYIGKDYILQTYNVYEGSAPEVDALVNRGFQITHGPGFRVARNSTSDFKEVLYRVEIWNSLVFHASITKKN